MRALWRLFPAGVAACAAPPPGAAQATSPIVAPSFSGAADAAAASSSPPESATRARIIATNDHCTAVKRIATSMGLLPGAREELTVRRGPEIGDAREAKAVGLVIPSGFDLCTVSWSAGPSLNGHHIYTCRSRPLASLSPDAFETVSRVWRGWCSSRKAFASSSVSPTFSR